MQVRVYNILIGGAAGQGIDTTVDILEKLLKKSGYYVYTTRDFMSRIRGGHNFSVLRFGTDIITSHRDKLDGIIALNDETVEIHKSKLNKNGFILCDSSLSTKDSQAIKLSMDTMAKEIGNQRVTGSIAVGAILKIFGERLDYIEETMKTSVKEEHVEINLKAITAGYNSVEEKFPHLEGKYSKWMILSGNKALALGAIAAGLKFYSAYPMSPSTAIMEYLASKSIQAEIVVEQAEDESLLSTWLLELHLQVLVL